MVNVGFGDLSCGRKELLDENGKVVFWFVGDTLDQVFTFLNPDGTPVDLTGLIYKGKLTKSLAEGAFVYFDKALTLTDPVNGVATLNIVAGDLIDAGNFILEIYEDLGGGSKKTIDQYNIEILESIV